MDMSFLWRAGNGETEKIGRIKTLIAEAEIEQATQAEAQIGNKHAQLETEQAMVNSELQAVKRENVELATELRLQAVHVHALTEHAEVIFISRVEWGSFTHTAPFVCYSKDKRGALAISPTIVILWQMQVNTDSAYRLIQLLDLLKEKDVEIIELSKMVRMKDLEREKADLQVNPSDATFCHQSSDLIPFCLQLDVQSAQIKLLEQKFKRVTTERYVSEFACSALICYMICQCIPAMHTLLLRSAPTHARTTYINIT
jgi:hypothetical protein